MFQQSGFGNFKWYYENEVLGYYSSYFKSLPSYNRFVELMPNSLTVVVRLLNYLLYQNRRYSSGLEYIYSTKLAICHNKRTNSHKLFAGLAELGKSSMGWFFGFKLHITCDTSGNLTAMAITKGNVDDRVPVLKLMSEFKGKLFADKGYIDKKLSANLAKLGITLVTQSKKNMKTRLMPAHIFDVIMLKKRSIIESIFNLLKNKLQLCHTRHRSITNYIVHIVAVLTRYQLFCNKPKINCSHLLASTN